MAAILLLSGYHALSQAHWADTIQHYGREHQWTLLSLPPRYFSWRMRGNPLSFSALNDQALKQHYDLIIATSSVDLATLQSIHPALRQCTSVLYFHENQFAYPPGNTPQHMVDWQITSVYSALRANYLVFNSRYNQDSFTKGASDLLKKMPDLVPQSVVNSLVDKSKVLPVPVHDVSTAARGASQIPLNLLWNHRWEWDKQPELLLEIIQHVENRSLPVKFFITGQSFRRKPKALQDIQSRFSHLVEHQGFIDQRSDYEKVLVQADVVLSTAVHEFQGISVLEAASVGCIPLLPNRLSYPEFFGPEYLYNGQGSIKEQARSAVRKLEHWLTDGLPNKVDTRSVQKSTLLPAYQQAIQTWLER